MRFKVKEREGTFGKLNTRAELAGKDPEDSKTAVDLPVKWRGAKRDFDMLVVSQDGQKASEFFWTEQKIINFPHLRTFKLDRTPENLEVTIYDQNTARAKPLVFKGVSSKDISVTLEDKHIILVNMMLQLHPDEDTELPRLARLMGRKRKFEIIATQDEMFPSDDDEEEEEEEQGSLLAPDPDEEEEEEEEEEEVEDEDD